MLTINIPSNAFRYELTYNKKNRILSGALSGSTYNMNNTSIPRHNVINLIAYLYLSFQLGRDLFIDDNGLVEVHIRKNIISDTSYENRFHINKEELRVSSDNNYIYDLGYIPKVANFRESFLQYIKYIQENIQNTSYKTMIITKPSAAWESGPYLKFQITINTNIAKVDQVMIQKPHIYKELENTTIANKEKAIKFIDNTSDVFKINTLNDILMKSICA